MLLPRFSMRLLLAITTGFAVIFLVTKFAVNGAPWAQAIVTAIISLAILFAIFAMLFAAAFLVARGTRIRRRVAVESPFATDKLPPQIIPPREPT